MGKTTKPRSDDQGRGGSDPAHLGPWTPFWKHQDISRKFFAKISEGNDFSDAGTAKTRVQLQDFYEHGEGRLLVICPKTLMQTAWGNDIDTFRPELTYSLAKAGQREDAFKIKTDVVIINSDGVKDLVKNKKWLDGFTRAVVDECFPTGTLVDTPNGPRPIEILKPRDIVLTSSGPQPIEAVGGKLTDELVIVRLEDEAEIVCTPTHPFATTEGWREAGELRGMSVMRVEICSDSQYPIEQPRRAAVLQQKLLTSGHVVAKNARGTSSNTPKSRIKNAWSAIMESWHSLVGRFQTTIEPIGESSASETNSAWWQRQGSTNGAASTRDATEHMGIQSSDRDQTTSRQRVSNSVQSGLREPENKNGDRSRRSFTFSAQALGCEEGRFTGATRVESVTHIQCESPVRVFNLQVEGPHDYSVAGVLVHNSTMFKNQSTARTKALLAIRKYFKVRRDMTATPNPNSVMELYAPQLWLDGGARLGTSYYKLRSLLCHPEQNGPLPEHVKWVDNPAAQQQMMALLSDCTIRHEFDKVMTHVPPNHRNVKRFTLSRKAQAIYERLAEDAVVMIKENAVMGTNAAVLRAKLLQVASGAVYSSEGKYELVDTGRYELITELIDSADHSVVFFNWKHQRDELTKQFASAGYRFAVIDGAVSDSNRAQIVRDYQAGRYKTILMHPKTGAHGLTLTRGTLTVFSSPIYEADYLKQAIHRIYRGGQTQVTNTVMVQADNTVEGAVYERLNDKTQRMEDLLMLAAERKA